MWGWWWPLGGVAVLALIAIGVGMGWSANLWVAASVVAVVYVGVPVMAANLDDLADRRKQHATTSSPQPGPNPLQASGDAMAGSTGTPVPELPSQTAATPGIPAVGDTGSNRRSVVGATDTSQAASARRSPRAAGPPSPEMLRRRIAATTGQPLRPPEQPSDRPWRRIGSAQFAELVYALSVAVPSVNQADDTAGLSGVTRHLIKKGRDTPFQRWQAVLEQAIDDGVVDIVCSEALKLTNSAQLRAAIADWIGSTPSDS